MGVCYNERHLSVNRCQAHAQGPVAARPSYNVNMHLTIFCTNSLRSLSQQERGKKLAVKITLADC